MIGVFQPFPSSPSLRLLKQTAWQFVNTCSKKTSLVVRRESQADKSCLCKSSSCSCSFKKSTIKRNKDFWCSKNQATQQQQEEDRQKSFTGVDSLLLLQNYPLSFQMARWRSGREILHPLCKDQVFIFGSNVGYFGHQKVCLYFYPGEML